MTRSSDSVEARLEGALKKIRDLENELKDKAKQLRKAERTIERFNTSAEQTEHIIQRNVFMMKKAVADLEGENRRRLESEERERQAREVAEEATKTKSDFLANMSHELRTPMNGVLGMLELCITSSADSEQRDNLIVAERCAQDLLAIVNSILDFSKIEAGRMTLEKTEMSPWDAIDDALAVVAPVAHTKGVELRLEGCGQLPAQIQSDAVRFRQVLRNLLTNAIKFTHEGAVGLELRYDRGAEILSVDVHDSGIGIPLEKLDAVFEAFTQADASTTRKYGGTGLGLAIVRHLVQLLGGSIEVRSTVGKGSTFSFFVSAPFVKGYSALFTNVRAALVGTEARDGHLKDVLLSMGLKVDRWDTFEAIDSGTPDYDIVFTTKKDVDRDMLQVVLVDPLSPSNKDAVELRRPIRRESVRRLLQRHLTPHMPLEQTQTISLERRKKDVCVLVVDDNPVNRLLVRKMLTQLGFDCYLCEDGQEAVDAMKTRSFPIILMDCQMPRLDGYAATRKIRSLPIEQPVILALTADAFAESHQRCIEAGMNDRLTKPIDLNTLSRRLDAILDQTEG